jgi:hypothetical protein
VASINNILTAELDKIIEEGQIDDQKWDYQASRDQIKPMHPEEDSFLNDDEIMETQKMVHD